MRWLCLILLSACQGSAPPPAPVDPEIARLVDEATARARARDEERRKAMAQAVTDLVPRPDLGACPFHPELPDPRVPRGGGLDLERMKRELDVTQRVELNLRKPDQLLEGSGPLFRAFSSRTHGLAKGTLAYAKGELAEIDAEAFWDYDVVFVEDERIEPQRQGEDRYLPGRIRGRAFLYAYAEKKVLCAAEIDATSSGTLTVRTTQIGDEKPRDDFATKAGADLIMTALLQATGRLALAGPRQQR